MKSKNTKTLDAIRHRPRFKMHIIYNKNEYQNHLVEFIAKNTTEFHADMNSELAVIYVKNENTAFWKPNLTLRIEEDGDKNYIVGIIGPSSSVWTFFMFLYFIFVVLWMITITLWFVGNQINISNYEWALPASFFIILLIMATYSCSWIGKYKSSEETKKLKDFIIRSTLPLEKRN